MASGDDRDESPTVYKTGSEHPSNKVARLIAEYDLGTTFGDRLEELWTADGDERESLRSLADRFNKRLLQVAITDAGTSTLDGEVANLYRLLTSDDVSSGQRAETRHRLQWEGVDVDKLKSDFVTHQAIQSYLKNYRGADYKRPSDETRIENGIETIQRLTTRTRLVAEKSLDHFRSISAISLGEFRVFVEIDVLCEECNSQYGIVELLEQGGCNCEHE